MVRVMNSFGVRVRVRVRVGIRVYVINRFVRLQNHKNQSHVKFWASELVRAKKKPHVLILIDDANPSCITSRSPLTFHYFL